MVSKFKFIFWSVVLVGLLVLVFFLRSKFRQTESRATVEDLLNRIESHRQRESKIDEVAAGKKETAEKERNDAKKSSIANRIHDLLDSNKS